MIKSTRALIAAVVGTFMLGATVGAAGISIFSDLDGSEWYADAAGWAADTGLVEGIDGEFAGDLHVNRAQLVTVFKRYNDYLMGEMDEMLGDIKMEDDGDSMEDGGEAMEEEGVTVTVTNLSDDMPLSPGLLVVHTGDVSLDFAGSLAPAELEKLAEVGDPAELSTFVKGLEGVVGVYDVDGLDPGASVDVLVDETDETLYVSVISMAVASNDGYALVDMLALKSGEEMTASNYDAGFEENSDLHSGFDGGQPDPAEGDANLDNGTATDPQAEVAMHDQLTTDLMKAMVN